MKINFLMLPVISGPAAFFIGILLPWSEPVLRMDIGYDNM